MAKTNGKSKYNKVKFNLFERDGQIMISLQMILSETRRSGVHREEVLEYYVAQDHKNIQAIMNTLVETAKGFAFVDGNLEATYRQNDIFVIQDYEHIKYRPELQRFVRKFDKKISHAQKRDGIKNLHISENRRKFLLVRNVVGIASVIIGGITFLTSSEYGRKLINTTELFQNESTKDIDQEKEIDKLVRNQEILLEAGRKQIEDVQGELIAQSLNVSQMPEISKEDLIAVIKPIEDKEEIDESNFGIELASAQMDITEQSKNESQELIAQNVITGEKINAMEMVMPSSRQASMNELAKDIPIVMNETGTGINYVETYNLSPTEIDAIKATVQHESGHLDEREVYAVMSTVINRSKSGRWNGGQNPYKIITASGQFQSYYEGHYEKYLNGQYAEYTDQIVDAMLAGELEPFHEFESFGSGPNATGVQFTKNGNKFH